MFKEVPLVNIDTQDVSIKIPSLTSDDINKYTNYLTMRIEKNGKIIEDRTDMLNQMLALCGTTSKIEAQKEIDILSAELQTITNERVRKEINSEISGMQKIINLKEDTTAQKMGSDVKNI